MKRLFAKLAVAAIVNGAFAFSAVAAPCAAGTEDDFTYRSTPATACVADGGNPGNSLNVFGDTYAELVKFDLSQTATVGRIFTGSAMPFGTAPNNGTITFGLKYLGLVGDGFYGYELLVTDTPETLIPAYLDLVGLVKQANSFQAYEFDNAFIGDSGNLGTFKSLFGPNANNAFSHFSVYGTNYQACSPTDPRCGGPGDETPLPEPASLALVGLGLLGVAAARRRKAQAAKV